MGSFAEWLGYLASVLIAVSLMMHSILRLRIINLIGAIFFTAYGLWIQAFPVAAVNGFIILIDLYFLFEMRKSKEYFEPLQVMAENAYLQKFLSYYKEDIQKFFPAFNFDLQNKAMQYFFILRDMVPAGLVAYYADDQNKLWVTLDYAIPGYRDFKTGRYVFSRSANPLNLKQRQEVYTITDTPEHAKYLKKIGYIADPDMGEHVYHYQLKRL